MCVTSNNKWDIPGWYLRTAVVLTISEYCQRLETTHVHTNHQSKHGIQSWLDNDNEGSNTASNTAEASSAFYFNVWFMARAAFYGFGQLQVRNHTHLEREDVSYPLNSFSHSVRLHTSCSGSIIAFSLLGVYTQQTQTRRCNDWYHISSSQPGSWDKPPN